MHDPMKMLRDVHDAIGHALTGRVSTDVESYQSAPIPPLPRQDGEAERLRAEVDRLRAEIIRWHVAVGGALAALENVVAGLRALTTVGPTA